MRIRDEVVEMLLVVIMRFLGVEMVMTKTVAPDVQCLFQQIHGMFDVTLQMLDQTQFVK